MNRCKSVFQVGLVLGIVFSLFSVTGIKPVNADTSDEPNNTYLPVINHSLAYSFSHSGPLGGTVAALASLTSQPGILYAGSWGSGIYKSVDSGAHWNFSSSGLNVPFVYSLAIDPETPSTIFAGTYEGGIYKSTNSGATWNAVNNGLNSTATVYALAINPKNSNIILAGMRVAGLEATLQTSYCKAPIYDYGGGVFRSTDGGASWTQVDGGQACGFVYGLTIDPHNPNNVYVATHEKGVLRSTNGGASFAYSNAGLGDPTTRSIVVDPTSPNRVYVSSWHGSAVFYSHDYGQDWNTANSGISGKNILKLAIDSNHISSNGCAWLFGLAYGGGTGVIKSTNCGSSWSWIGSGAYTSYPYDLTIQPSNIFYATTTNGIYRSNSAGDDSSWAQMNNGLSNTNINTLVYDPHTPTTFYAGTANTGIFKSTDSGETWSTSSSGLPTASGSYTGILKIAVDPTNSSILYAGTDDNGIYKSTNAGVTWSQTASGLPTSSNSTSGIESSLSSPTTLLNDPLFIESEDDADSQISSTAYQSIHALAVNPTTPSTVYAGGSNGVLISTNSGGSWSADGLNGISVYALAIDPASTNTIFAGTASGIYKTTNSGSNWALLGLSSYLVDDIKFGASGSASLYAATQGNGIYTSANGGTLWNSLNNGLTNLTVYSLAMDTLNPATVYAGTANGVYRYNFSTKLWQALELDDNVTFANPVMTTPVSTNTVFAGTRAGTVIITFTN